MIFIFECLLCRSIVSGILLNDRFIVFIMLIHSLGICVCIFLAEVHTFGLLAKKTKK